MIVIFILIFAIVLFVVIQTNIMQRKYLLKLNSDEDRLNTDRDKFFNSKVVIKCDGSGSYPREILVHDEIYCNDAGSCTYSMLKINMELVLKKGEIIRSGDIMMNISKELHKNGGLFKEEIERIFKNSTLITDKHSIWILSQYKIFLSVSDYGDFVSIYGYNGSFEYVLMNIPKTGKAYVHCNKPQSVEVIHKTREN